MNVLIVLCLVFFHGLWAAPVFTVQSTKEAYPLNWETIYKLNVCNAYSTVIEPPQGYVLSDIVLGDSKLFKAEKTGNKAIIKRLAPDNVSSNLVLILEGPDKLARSLTFELTGMEWPRISNVQFIAPEQRGRNPDVEAAHALCKTQLEMTLMDQEKRLSGTIRERTLEKVEPFQLDGDLSTEKLGAKIHLDAILNNAGKAYVYLSTNIDDPDFQVVQLTGIQGKDLAKTVTLFRTHKDEHGTQYIYETTPFVKCDVCKKYQFFFRVYHEHAQIEAKVK